MDLKLKNKTVLITGSNGDFLFHGSNVVLHVNKNKDNVEKLFEKYPSNSLIVQGDVRKEEEVISCVLKAQKKFGIIEILVLNHGIFPPEDISIDMSLERFKNTIDVNLTGCFLFAREFLKQLKNKKVEAANIIIIGSTSALFGEEGHIDYSSSKSALSFGFMKTLKNEIVRICPKGRVNVVSPGWVKTPMAEEALQDEKLVKKVFQTLPMRKVATTKDVSRSVLFLASQEVSYHTRWNGGSCFI